MLVGDSMSGVVSALLCEVAVAVTIRMKKSAFFVRIKEITFLSQTSWLPGGGPPSARRFFEP